jgi:predicted phosphoadenosine phosphosulfate sulfurtransferase
MKRCYFSDIPDEVPVLLASTNRAPSYKAIAIAVLRNDNQLLSLGFARKESHLTKVLMLQDTETRQLSLF